MTTAQPILLLSDARGIYIPRDFANEIRLDCLSGVSHSDLGVLQSGPDHPDYWETWESVMINAKVVNPATGDTYYVYQDGDCWLLPEGMEVNDDGEFVWPVTHGLDCRCTDCQSDRGDWEYHNRKDEAHD